MSTQEQQTMHLQGIGRVAAIPAAEVKVGMRMIWNYGGTTDVVAVEQTGPKTLKIEERGTRDGKLYTRTCRTTRLIAAYWPKDSAGK